MVIPKLVFDVIIAPPLDYPILTKKVGVNPPYCLFNASIFYRTIFIRNKTQRPDPHLIIVYICLHNHSHNSHCKPLNNLIPVWCVPLSHGIVNWHHIMSWQILQFKLEQNLSIGPQFTSSEQKLSLICWENVLSNCLLWG